MTAADRRRAMAVAAASVFGALAVAGAWAGAGRASAPLTFSVVNGTVNAGADRFEAGSDAFPNFRNGAFNNYYPMAHARVDGSPSSEGTASSADTGPIGQALAGGTFGTPPFPQPQYAHALYPPGTTTPVTVGSTGGPYAAATAALNSASARAQFGSSAASSSASVPASPGSAARLATLDRLLISWRAEWLTAAAAIRYPMVHPTAATPDGVTFGTAATNAALDPTQGLVLSGVAHAQSAGFGGGAIRIGNVDVSVTSTNSGTPAHQISVHVGSASVGGVPVTIDHNGVSVNQSAVPGVGMAIDQANTALNQALAQSGYALRTLAPQITRSANQETVDATGVEVDYTQPAVAPGVPRQQAVDQVGEVFVDSLAAPATASPTAVPPGAVSVTVPGVSPPATISITGTAGNPGTPGIPAQPGSPGTPAPSSTAGTQAPARSLIAVRRARPIDLVLLYFLWQSVVIGTVASLWWRRLGSAPGSAP